MNLDAIRHEKEEKKGSVSSRILVASPGFVARTSPAAVPDFMMTNLIPPAYLAAGSLTFERDANDSAMWRLSWGGTGYTGSNQGELFTNDADGDFGPPYPFSLPSTCGRALLFPGPASAPSTTNLNDYALSADPAVFVNNAGTDFTVVATPGPCSESQIVISLDTVATGLTAPVFLTHAGDGSGRLFIVDQAGQIRIVDAGGTLLPTPFLDLTDRMVTVNPSFDERGLLGLAFHPDYAVNGRLFVRYSAPRTGVIGEPCFGTPRGCHKEVLAEFNQCILCPGDPNIADPSSEIILFEVDEPQFNHNSGQVLFGPDGLLYFSLGDGGGAHDGLADIPPSHGPTGNGQNVNTTLGSIVRIDVDGPPAPGLKYGIPPGNPFAAGGGAPEIYAYGFRNPYRFSFFDTGGLIPSRLIVGDVGQALIEEIDLLPVVPAPGLLNYGWVIREGTLCFDPLNPSVPKPACTDIGPLGETMIDPVLEYDHSVGIAVVGGFVYRGTAVPALSGKYVFGDFSQDFGPTGRLFYAGVLGLETITVGPRLEFFLAPTNEPLGKALFGIGEDENGELYVLASDNISPVGNTGVVLRIAEPPSVLPPRPEAKVTRKPRFVSFVPTNAGQQTALRLTLLSLPGPFSVWNGQQLW
ncbi:MAG: PQQ-dependent sugar dehydrogenase, partial [Phycisphaerae bacterium]